MKTETISLNPLDSVPSSWTGNDLLNWWKMEDSISPPIRKLLPYDNPKAEMAWEGLETFGELMFIYINKDLWGFNNA